MIGAIEKGALAVAVVEMISLEIGSIGHPEGPATEAEAIGAIANLLAAYHRGVGPKPRGDA